MSQVVVCQDNLSPKREKSLEQEKKIETADALAKWQRSDATRTLLIERVFVILFAPLVLFWALLLSCIGVTFAFVLAFFKIFGRLLGFFGGGSKKVGVAT